jgi:hypothetical protein
VTEPTAPDGAHAGDGPSARFWFDFQDRRRARGLRPGRDSSDLLAAAAAAGVAFGPRDLEPIARLRPECRVTAPYIASLVSTYLDGHSALQVLDPWTAIGTAVVLTKLASDGRLARASVSY